MEKSKLPSKGAQLKADSIQKRAPVFSASEKDNNNETSCGHDAIEFTWVGFFFFLLAIARFLDTDFSQEAIIIVFRCNLTVILHLSGFKL